MVNENYVRSKAIKREFAKMYISLVMQKGMCKGSIY